MEQAHVVEQKWEKKATGAENIFKANTNCSHFVDRV